MLKKKLEENYIINLINTYDYSKHVDMKLPKTFNEKKKRIYEIMVREMKPVQHCYPVEIACEEWFHGNKGLDVHHGVYDIREFYLELNLSHDDMVVAITKWYNVLCTTFLSIVRGKNLNNEEMKNEN